MKEPTHALLRIELERWKPLLPSLCEVSVPVEGGTVSCADKLLADKTGHILTWHCLDFTYPLQLWVLALIYSKGEILALLICQAKF